MEERPPADPAKLATTLRDWHAGDLLPGRAMADLKHGRFDILLGDLSAGREDLAAVAETWGRWEKAKAGPAEVLETLWDADLVDILGELAAS